MFKKVLISFLFIIFAVVSSVSAQPAELPFDDLSGFYNFHAVTRNCVSDSGTWIGNSDEFPYPNTVAELICRSIGDNDTYTSACAVDVLDEGQVVRAGTLYFRNAEVKAGYFELTKELGDGIPPFVGKGIVVLYKNWLDYVITVHPSTKLCSIYATPYNFKRCDIHVSFTSNNEITSWDGLVNTDTDGDGVFDDSDKCPDTPEDAQVDENGCPLDTDGDSVPDYVDSCPETTPDTIVDENGCPLDSDDDGVIDSLDACPNDDGSPHDNPDYNGCAT